MAYFILGKVDFMKCEILAPAGNSEAFLAACEAGADAVYAGVSSFNARQRAKNFTYRDFAALVDYAHGRNIKVYAAFNTLIKQKELPAALDAAAHIVSAGADAFIIQDLGVLKMMKSYFPKTPVHASTQMAVHNSEGVRFLEKQGFERVVLARELSFDEIRSISGRTSAELEIFVHGALCFSMSGMCLASSCIGGCSGNRGLCVQPCRRAWSNNGIERFFFSTCDIDASSYAEGFKKLGIASLKIEGRMKNSEYVARTVRYWRNLIDGRELPEPENFSRKKSSYYFDGKKGQILNSGKSPCVGMFAGVIRKCGNGRAAVVASFGKVCEGDSARIINNSDEEICSFSIKNIRKGDLPEREVLEGEGFSFACDCDAEGMRLFISGRPMDFLKGLGGRLSRIFKTAKKYREPAPIPDKRLLPEFLNNSRKIVKSGREAEVFVKIPAASSFSLLGEYRPDRLIVSFDPSVEPVSMKRTLKGFPIDRVILSLPPFIPESGIERFKNASLRYFREGFRNWQAENISHFSIIPKGASISAGHFIYSLNSMALRQIKDFKASFYVTSYEDDYINIRNRSCFGELPAVMTVFAYVPVFTSAAVSLHFFAEGSKFKNSSFSMSVKRADDYVSFILDKPFSVMQHISRLSELSPAGFLINLEHAPQSKEIFESIFESFVSESPFPNSDKFNFKRELK